MVTIQKTILSLKMEIQLSLNQIMSLCVGKVVQYLESMHQVLIEGLLRLSTQEMMEQALLLLRPLQFNYQPTIQQLLLQSTLVPLAKTLPKQLLATMPLRETGM